ncbi:MAG: archaellin/type IV pilin N-terminal domain-containing protein [Halobacteriota archaeon]|nr:archaellin/type IV pilin N-terminal domain-containing protein [Halobacteriota archaeon]
MKANQRSSIREDESAQMGIGTLIIFIAMVLVAAVAAAVLIQTSGVLQQRATETGKEATAEVASNIAIETIVGHRASTSTNDLEYVNMTIKVMAGAGDIDLSMLRISLQNETTRTENIQFNTTTIGTTAFTVTELRDEDSSYDPNNSNYVINSGDLVIIELQPGMDFPSREPMRIEIKPEHGAAVIRELTMPPSYGVDIYLPIFP